MNRQKTLLAVTIVAVTAFPTGASAQLEVCDATNERFFVAVAYSERQSNELLVPPSDLVRGWFVIQPGETATLVSDPSSWVRIYFKNVSSPEFDHTFEVAQCSASIPVRYCAGAVSTSR